MISKGGVSVTVYALASRRNCVIVRISKHAVTTVVQLGECGYPRSWLNNLMIAKTLTRFNVRSLEVAKL
jgi:hypothetical protein